MFRPDVGTDGGLLLTDDSGGEKGKAAVVLGEHKFQGQFQHGVDADMVLLFDAAQQCFVLERVGVKLTQLKPTKTVVGKRAAAASPPAAEPAPPPSKRTLFLFFVLFG